MANSSNEFNQTVASLFKGMDAFLTTKTVVGDPIQVGEITIIPLSDVNFGVGAGAMAGSSANSAGGGMGGKLSPSAIIVVKDGYAQIMNVNAEQSSVAKLIDMIPGVADKISAKLKKKEPTDEEMKQVEEVKDTLTDQDLSES